jgi:hypothetical protein
MKFRMYDVPVCNRRARSAHAFIAVCGSARTDHASSPAVRRVSGAAWLGRTAPLTRRTPARMMLPCAVAHGYKRAGATRPAVAHRQIIRHDLFTVA